MVRGGKKGRRNVRIDANNDNSRHSAEIAPSNSMGGAVSDDFALNSQRVTDEVPLACIHTLAATLVTVVSICNTCRPAARCVVQIIITTHIRQRSHHPIR